MDFLEPSSPLTCSVTFDDTHRDAGPLEYAPGSHKWPLTRSPMRFTGKQIIGRRWRLPPRLHASNRPSPFSLKCQPAPAFSIAAKRGTARRRYTAIECACDGSACCRSTPSAIVPATASTSVSARLRTSAYDSLSSRRCGPLRHRANWVEAHARAARVTLRKAARWHCRSGTPRRDLSRATQRARPASLPVH